jgi:hypothetical protein
VETTSTRLNEQGLGFKTSKSLLSLDIVRCIPSTDHTQYLEKRSGFGSNAVCQNRTQQEAKKQATLKGQLKAFSKEARKDN